MALPKRVKSGGSYYKGYSKAISAATADYTLEMTLTANDCVINGITIIPTGYGAGDYYKLEHTDSSDTVLETLCETIYNIGANAGHHFDFASLEPMDAGDKLILTYTNVAGVAMTVYTVVERIK